MIKTCHTRLKLTKSQTDLLDSMCDLYTKAKHTGFKLIAKSNILLFKNNINNLTTKDIITSLSSEQKKLLAYKFNLTGRHVNSINIELGMIISSYIEQRNNHLSDLNYSLSKMTKSISKYNKANSDLEVKFNILKQSNFNKQIYAYKQFIVQNKSNKNNLKNTNRFIFNYKNSNLPQIINAVNLKNLLLTPQYMHIDSKLLAANQTYGKNLFQIHLLNKKLIVFKNKISKIEKDINQGKIRICFGTKVLFKQQNLTKDNINILNPQSILFEDHIDWLISWYDSRSHQFLITGAGEETSGNQNCNAHLNEKGLFNLRLRLSDNLINKLLIKDKFLTIEDVDFGKNNSLLQSSLLSETKEVRILTIAEKEVIKELKDNLFELKKNKFKLTSKIKVANKAIINFDSTNLNNDLLEIDDEIITLQKEIDIKSNIFTLNNKEIINNDSLNKENNSQDLSRTRKKKIAIPITYRFVKNIDRNSPKYGTWSVYFTVEVKEPEIITDISLGAIGVDLNENHLAVTEIDPASKLIQSFNIYFNPETYNSNNSKLSNELKNKVINKNIANKPFKLLDSNNNKLITLSIVENQFKLNEKSNTRLSEISTDKTQNILGNAIRLVTNLSLTTGKPIIIEKLDFTQKKKQLVSTSKLTNKLNNKFNYNHMINSFAYGKFKEILKSQSARSGLQVIEVNPAYSSLIGAVNYVKPLGLSIHMAASYVIAQRGLNKNSSKYKIDEKPRLIVVKENKLNKNKPEIYTKSKVYLLDYIVNSSLTEDRPADEWSIISNLYKTLQKDIYKENLQKEKLKSLMKSLPTLSNELDLSYLFSEDSFQVHDTQ